MNEFTMYTDGGARGNPGPAAIGVVIFEDPSAKPVREISEYVGVTTNNQAEYQALIRGLAECASLGAKSVQCFLDSELVVKQLQGLYKVKEPGLQKQVLEVFRLAKNFKQIEYAHVLREKNQLADKLVNEALDKVRN